MRARAIVLAGAFALSAVLPAAAQQTIKIGELNSYKAAPAFLDPYKKGWEMAIDEINAAGGVLGKKREVVNILAGTFLSNIGLAVTEFAGKKKVFFFASEPLTDKITWENGNKYT